MKVEEEVNIKLFRRGFSDSDGGVVRPLKISDSTKPEERKKYLQSIHVERDLHCKAKNAQIGSFLWPGKPVFKLKSSTKPENCVTIYSDSEITGGITAFRKFPVAPRLMPLLRRPNYRQSSSKSGLLRSVRTSTIVFRIMLLSRAKHGISPSPGKKTTDVYSELPPRNGLLYQPSMRSYTIAVTKMCFPLVEGELGRCGWSRIANTSFRLPSSRKILLNPFSSFWFVFTSILSRSPPSTRYQFDAQIQRWKSFSIFSDRLFSRKLQSNQLLLQKILLSNAYLLLFRAGSENRISRIFDPSVLRNSVKKWTRTTGRTRMPYQNESKQSDIVRKCIAEIGRGGVGVEPNEFYWRIRAAFPLSWPLNRPAIGWSETQFFIFFGLPLFLGLIRDGNKQCSSTTCTSTLSVLKSEDSAPALRQHFPS
ncbi:unnamed protein product [Nesidiocoris tenuis]|uniref:Uncharacterized protein n=1 Tax=Nesidiocoris tenuis TaxID=355587 RepID=A0A6H5GSG3_9HEMI|nr:unnamed protein product [Nesidiocoris tenuis]